MIVSISLQWSSLGNCGVVVAVMVVVAEVDSLLTSTGEPRICGENRN